jgi:hypothetical protein
MISGDLGWIMAFGTIAVFFKFQSVNGLGRLE